jgi:hypothetical protein
VKVVSGIAGEASKVTTFIAYHNLWLLAFLLAHNLTVVASAISTPSEALEIMNVPDADELAISIAQLLAKFNLQFLSEDACETVILREKVELEGHRSIIQYVTR